MNKDAILARSVPDLTAKFSQQTLNLRGSYKSWVNKHGVKVEMLPVVKSLRPKDFAYRVTLDNSSLNSCAEICLSEGEGNIRHSEHNGNHRDYKSVVFSQNLGLRYFPFRKLSE